METQKNQYFRYYRPKTNHTSSSIRQQKMKSDKKKGQNHKLLPHISQEYHFRITNHLLLKKIISPKRDKLIMQSLQNVGKKLYSSHHSASYDKSKSSRKLKSMHHLKNHTESKQLITSIQARNTVNTEHRIRRKLLVNRTISIPDKGQTTSIVQNEVVDDDQPAFVRVNIPSKEIHFEKQNRDSSLLHGSCFINPPGGFGTGSTILRLSHLSINLNPMIKNDCLIQLQLIERPTFRQEIKGISYDKPQKTIKTNPFKYSQLPNEEHPERDIKFALNRSKVGDFIPLRIWKYIGLQCILVGTVDLSLIPFDSETWEFKKDDPQMGRKVFTAEVDKHLIKLKMHETDAKVQVKYKVYPKRFRQTIRETKYEN